MEDKANWHHKVPSEELAQIRKISQIERRRFVGKIANKQVICEVLMEAAKKTDQDIVALCSDSRGSASFAPFASEYPEQFVETGMRSRICKHLRWPGQMREEALCSVSGMLPVNQKYKSSAKSMGILQYKCKTDRHQRRRKPMGRWEWFHHSAQDIAAMAAVPNMKYIFQATGSRRSAWSRSCSG